MLESLYIRFKTITLQSKYLNKHIPSNTETIKYSQHEKSNFNSNQFTLF